MRCLTAMITLVFIAAETRSPLAQQADDSLPAKQCRFAAAEAVQRQGAKVVKVTAEPESPVGSPIIGDYHVRVEAEIAGERGIYTLKCTPSAIGPARLTPLTLTK